MSISRSHRVTLVLTRNAGGMNWWWALRVGRRQGRQTGRSQQAPPPPTASGWWVTRSSTATLVGPHACCSPSHPPRCNSAFMKRDRWPPICRVTRYNSILILEIDMVYRYGYLQYRYDHPRFQYGIWANDMGDDSVDIVNSHIDMGYLVTLLR